MRNWGALFSITIGRGLVFALGSAAGIFALLLIATSFYEAMGETFAQMYAQMPEEFQAFTGRGNTMGSVMAYLSAIYQHVLVMTLLSVGAIGSAGRAIAVEVDGGTSDLLFARPVARGAVLAAHVAGAALRLAIIASALPLGAAVATAATGLWGEFDLARAGAAGLTTFAIFFCVFGYALVVSALSRTGGTVYGVSGALTVVFFLLNFMSEAKEAWRAARYLTPFGRYRPFEILMGDRAPWGDAAALVGIASLCIGAAWVILRRRDL